MARPTDIHAPPLSGASGIGRDPGIAASRSGDLAVTPGARRAAQRWSHDAGGPRHQDFGGRLASHRFFFGTAAPGPDVCAGSNFNSLLEGDCQRCAGTGVVTAPCADPPTSAPA